MAAVRSDGLDIALEVDWEYVDDVESPRKWLLSRRRKCNKR
jgi:hypothetical protein